MHLAQPLGKVTDKSNLSILLTLSKTNQPLDFTFVLALTQQREATMAIHQLFVQSIAYHLPYLYPNVHVVHRL